MSAELIVECLALLGVLCAALLCAVRPRVRDTILTTLTLSQASDATTLAARYYACYYLAQDPEYRAFLDEPSPNEPPAAPSHAAAARRRRPHARPHVRSGARGRTCRRHGGYGESTQ